MHFGAAVHLGRSAKAQATVKDVARVFAAPGTLTAAMQLRVKKAA